MQHNRGEPNYLTIEEAAARRGGSAATIWRAIRTGAHWTSRILGRTVVQAEEVDRLPIPTGGGRWRKPVNAEEDGQAQSDGRPWQSDG